MMVEALLPRRCFCYSTATCRTIRDNSYCQEWMAHKNLLTLCRHTNRNNRRMQKGDKKMLTTTGGAQMVDTSGRIRNYSRKTLSSNRGSKTWGKRNLIFVIFSITASKVSIRQPRKGVSSTPTLLLPGSSGMIHRRI
jgi:hypothetical protein